MKRTNRLVLLIGVFLAVVAFVGIILLAGNIGPGGGQPAATSAVVVAAKDLTLGEQITRDEVTTKNIPVGSAPTDSYTDTALVIGKTVRTNVTAGAVLTASETFRVGSAGSEQDITPLLEPGQRGMSVQVDQVSGVGTLIHVGDRVDVVVSYETQQYTLQNRTPVTVGDQQTTVKMIIQNAKVVGTLLPAPTAQASSGTAGGTTLNGQQEIVILALTPQQAEEIKFAQIKGNISLVLRTPADTTAKDVTTSGVLLRTMIEKYGVLPPNLYVTP